MNKYMCFLWDSIFWANQESYEGVVHLLYIWAQLLIKLNKQLHGKKYFVPKFVFIYSLYNNNNNMSLFIYRLMKSASR